MSSSFASAICFKDIVLSRNRGGGFNLVPGCLVAVAGFELPCMCSSSIPNLPTLIVDVAQIHAGSGVLSLAYTKHVSIAIVVDIIVADVMVLLLALSLVESSPPWGFVRGVIAWVPW